MRLSVCRVLVPVTVYLVLSLDHVRGNNTTNGANSNRLENVTTTGDLLSIVNAGKTYSGTEVSKHGNIITEWSSGYETETKKKSNVNLAFLPVLAILFLIIFVFVRACKWYRNSSKMQERGCSYDVASYVILVQGDKHFHDVDIDSDNYDSVISSNSYVRPAVYETLTSSKSLQYHMDSQMYDTVTSYTNYLQKLKQAHRDIQLTTASANSSSSSQRMTKSTKVREAIKLPKESRFSIKPALDNYVRLNGVNSKLLMSPRNVRNDMAEQINGNPRKEATSMNITVNALSREACPISPQTMKGVRKMSRERRHANDAKFVNNRTSFSKRRRAVSVDDSYILPAMEVPDSVKSVNSGGSIKGKKSDHVEDLDKAAFSTRRRAVSVDDRYILPAKELPNCASTANCARHIRTEESKQACDKGLSNPKIVLNLGSVPEYSTVEPQFKRGRDISVIERNEGKQDKYVDKCTPVDEHAEFRCSYKYRDTPVSMVDAETQHDIPYRNRTLLTVSSPYRNRTLLTVSSPYRNRTLRTASSLKRKKCLDHPSSDTIEHNFRVDDGEIRTDRAETCTVRYEKCDFNERDLRLLVIQDSINNTLSPGMVAPVTISVCAVVHNVDTKTCPSNELREPPTCNIESSTNSDTKKMIQRQDVKYSGDTSDYSVIRDGFRNTNGKSLPCVSGLLPDESTTEKYSNHMNENEHLSSYITRRRSYQNITKSKHEIQNEIGPTALVEMVY